MVLAYAEEAKMAELEPTAVFGITSVYATGERTAVVGAGQVLVTVKEFVNRLAPL